MEQNLKKRCLTASIMLPLVVLGILFLPLHIFAVLSGAIFLLGGWEWTRLSGFIRRSSRFLAFLIGIVFAWLLENYLSEANLLYLTFVLWGVTFINVLLFPLGKRLLAWSWTDLLLGTCFLTTGWHALMNLRHMPEGPIWVLCACSIVWITDTSAYVVGKYFGRHWLAPAVSPKKTWEGVVGAFLGVGVATTFAWHTIGMLQKYSLIQLLWITMGTSVAAIFGDLVESLFKRVRGVKDSGILLPGHGGILDRIDGLMIALPIFVVYIK